MGPTLLAMGNVFAEAALEIVPFFLLAVLVGAWIEEYVSEQTIARFLTGRRPGTMLLASTTGAVIPLCTCGMVPLAVSLRRRGSDVKHTFAFLTAGASVSVPVLFLTWKLLGFEWALVRFLVSILFGLVVGYAAIWALRREAARSTSGAEPRVASQDNQLPDLTDIDDVSQIRVGRSRAMSVLRRFRGQLIEYGPWVLVSLAVASVINVLVPQHWIHVLYGERTWAGGLLASLSGLPFYFCSGAELPLVRELLAKGMGPGPGTAMLLSVPIVNILTFGVASRWLGARGALIYLALCVGGSTLLGELTGFVWMALAS